MRHTTKTKSSGFTLIELLVVIAIIGILSSVVLASLNTARNKAKDAKRFSDMHAIQTALELYKNDNNAYPIGGPWNSQCTAWGGGQSADNVIPGLVPTYISKMPTDPDMNSATSECCYLYYSNGTDYKFLLHNCSTSNYGSQPSLIDPRRDGGAETPTGWCTVDGNSIWSWAIESGNLCAQGY